MISNKHLPALRAVYQIMFLAAFIAVAAGILKGHTQASTFAFVGLLGLHAFAVHAIAHIRQQNRKVVAKSLLGVARYPFGIAVLCVPAALLYMAVRA